MTDLESIIEWIKTERRRQDKKWGEQNHDHYHWQPILLEELGEASMALNEATVALKSNQEPEAVYYEEQMHKELIQTAAVIVAMLECFLRNGPLTMLKGTSK